MYPIMLSKKDSISFLSVGKPFFLLPKLLFLICNLLRRAYFLKWRVTSSDLEISFRVYRVRVLRTRTAIYLTFYSSQSTLP